MTDIASILARCHELGITLEPASDGRLRYKGRAPPDLLDLLQKHKAAILAYLQPPTKAPTRREIARLALIQAGVKRDILQQVLQAAERYERDWGFLVRQHGYPVGWFVLCHVDNYLRLNHGTGIATEELPDENITSWSLTPASPDILKGTP